MTGAASGIGFAVAKRLVADGHRVTVFDQTEPELPVDHFIALDLADDGAIDRALAEASGPFDALINNAGLPPREGLEEIILRVNWFGLRRCWRACWIACAPVRPSSTLPPGRVRSGGTTLRK